MNKKNLPKAIMRSSGTGGEPSTVQSRATAARSRESNYVFDEKSGATKADLGATVIEFVPTSESSLARVTEVQPVPAPIDAQADAAQRQLRARAIVERHATYSAVGGAIPLPLVNLAGITTIIVRMVKVLSDLYNVPFERGRARAIVTGLLGGAATSGVTFAATSPLLYVAPAGALVGIALSATTAAACTRRIGKIFVSHFESGATLRDFPVGERR